VPRQNSWKLRTVRLVFAALYLIPAAGLQLVASAQVSAGGVLFSDDFASGLSSAWTVVDEGTVDAPSNWRVVNGVLEQASNINDGNGQRDNLPKLGTYLLTGSPGWSDYSVSVRMLAADDDAMGVMFGYQDQRNYYRFSMDQTRAYRRLVKFVNGLPTLLAEDAVAPVQNRWYAVQVNFAAGVLEVWLDGQLLFRVNDTSHASGKVALYSWAQAIARFDDVVITSLGTAPACSYSISPTQASATSAATTGSVNVSAPSGCDWTAASNVPWIAISGGASGSGGGTVNYSVQANTSSSSRQGTLTIAGQTFTVTQAGASSTAGCSFSLTPAAASVGAAATTGSVTVTAGAGCAWTAASNASWISISSGAAGSGNGTVNYSVQANNSSSPRQGTLTIAGITFTVSQTAAGCTFNLSPTTANIGPATFTGTVKVNTTWLCSWTASSGVPWISITSGAGRTGTGTVQYSVAPNPSPQPRQGFLSIAGQTFTLWQAGTTGASTIWYVPSGWKIQPILDQAQLGDTITLEPGGMYRGFVRLRNKPGTAFLTITVADPSRIPPAGIRVTPPYFANLPKLISPDNRPVVQTDAGAHHYRLVGLELSSPSGMYPSAVIRLGTSTQTSLAQVPSYIELDRLYIHGDPRLGGGRGVELQSAQTVIHNCYFQDFKSTYQESQAIAGWNGPGPFQIENNYLEGAGENVIFGGALAAIPGLIPSDIVIRRNHFYKPLSWCPRHPSYAGTTWIVKNLFELKNAARVLVEENIFENNWQQAQQGYAIVLTVRSQYGQMPWVVVEDVTFQRNIIRHAGAGVNLLGRDYNGGYLGFTRRILFKDNLFYDIDSSVWGGDGRMFQVLEGVENLVINHNTLIQNRHLMTFDGIPSLGLVFTNNIAPTNVYGMLGSGTGTGFPTFQRYAPDIVVAGNVLAGGPASKYPSNNYFPPDLNAVGFVDLAGDDYRLSVSSPYRGAGTDGLDVGGDINAILAVTAGVIQ
jgi:hypothetical protein